MIYTFHRRVFHSSVHCIYQWIFCWCFATTAPHALMYSVVCGFECEVVLLWLLVCSMLFYDGALQVVTVFVHVHNPSFGCKTINVWFGEFIVCDLVPKTTQCLCLFQVSTQNLLKTPTIKAPTDRHHKPSDCDINHKMTGGYQITLTALLEWSCFIVMSL